MSVGDDGWSEAETAALLDAYFEMLVLELERTPYVKADFNRSVRDATGRSKGSVEFKFCNVSAVLDERGRPYVHGYKPRANYQRSLAEAVDARLEHQDGASCDPHPGGQVMATAAANTDKLDSLIARLWNYATGGREVAARPENSRAPLASGPPAAGLDGALEWVKRRLAEPDSDPVMLFLIGGPGAGKSHASAGLVEPLDPVDPPDDGLAHRVYRFRAAGRELRVINDATIPAELGSTASLAEDIHRSFEERSHLVACINRGILVEEQASRSAGASSDAAGAVLRWLGRGVAGASQESAVLAEGGERDYLRTARAYPDGELGVDAVAVYLDVCSLLEPSPTAQVVDGEDAPEVVADAYSVLRVEDRAAVAVEALPAGYLFTRVLTMLDVDLQDSERNPWDPVVANIQSLRHADRLHSLLTMLRASEFASGQYLTYRELWGVLVRAIVGKATFSMSPQELRDWIALPLPEDPKERWERLKELAALRWHQALFDSGAATAIRATRDPVARLTLPLDPVRDALPGHFDVRGDTFGWASPVIDGFSGHSARSPLATILESLPDDHPFVHAQTDFDRLLDEAYVAIVSSHSVKSDSEREGLGTWYGAYLTRSFAAALGITAHRQAFSLWARTYNQEASLPSQLTECLSTMLRPKVSPSDVNSPSVIALFDSRTSPLVGGSRDARVGVVISGVELAQEKDRRGGLLLVLKENGKVIGRVELDFALIRNALASTASHVGMTELTGRVGPRLERFRAARLRPDNIPPGQTYVALRGDRLAQFGVKGVPNA